MIAALRVIDLRSELEAQLRAVSRLEALLQKSDTRRLTAGELATTIDRELAQMLQNNASIRIVLIDLVSEAARTEGPDV